MASKIKEERKWQKKRMRIEREKERDRESKRKRNRKRKNKRGEKGLIVSFCASNGEASNGK
jgi:hypothetical protein